MDLKLDNRLALVTGSTAGIGYASSRALLNEGARVIINGRTQDGVDAAIKQLKLETGETPAGFAGDMSTVEAANKVFAAHPSVEILVNNVGAFQLKAFEETTDEEWNSIFQLNVMSGVRLARLYLPGMLRRNWGRVIFVSSESALQIPAESIHYGMSKAAQIAVARGLAELTVGTAVTVNSILPGPTKSRAAQQFVGRAVAQGQSGQALEKKFFEERRPTSLIKRFADPDEVASLVVYVASPLSSATTGAALRVDGGVVKSAF